MSNSKNEAYQQKILQLLLREKAVQTVNQTLCRENNTLKDKVASLQRDHEAKIKQAENSIAQAEMEIRLARMGRISEEEKRVEVESNLNELNQSFDLISLKNKRLEDEGKSLLKQINEYTEEQARKESTMAALEQKCQRLEESLKKINEMYANAQVQIEQLTNAKSSLTRVNTKIQAEFNRIQQLYQDALQKIDNYKNEVAIKAKIKIDKQDENSRYQEKLEELSKENSLLRDRKKKLQQELKLIEQEKEQLAYACKQAEKLNKKNKDIILENETRIKELQDESQARADKCRLLETAAKAAKRQIQQLKQNLHSAQQAVSSESSKYRKYEATSKTQKTELIEKEQKLQELQQIFAQLKKDLQGSQRSVLQLSIQIEKLSRENKYLSEQSQEQQEKRILLEGEKEKAISMIVRDKDILSRANFKLLQLLELKDQAVKTILQSIQNKSDKLEVATILEGQELLKLIKNSDKEKLKNGKERIGLLDEWIKSKK